MSDNVIYPECFLPRYDGQKVPPSLRHADPANLRRHLIATLLKHRPYWSERRIIEAAGELEKYIREGWRQ